MMDSWWRKGYADGYANAADPDAVRNLPESVTAAQADYNKGFRDGYTDGVTEMESAHRAEAAQEEKERHCPTCQDQGEATL